jgi:transglutaminase-like putative cysteine protease
MKKEHQTQLAIVGIIVILAIYAMRVNISTVSVVSGDTNAWGDYIADKAEYISGTSDMDNTVELKNVAEEIQESSTSSKAAIKKTAEYVYKNVQYKGDISTLYCFTEKASDVYETKQGDCVSMSKLTAALLRLQGIPARTVGGCVKYNVLVLLFPHHLSWTTRRGGSCTSGLRHGHLQKDGS